MRVQILCCVLLLTLMKTRADVVPCYCALLSGTWTQYYDRDDASGSGDWETYSAQAQLGTVCQDGPPLCMEFIRRATSSCHYAGRPEIQCAAKEDMKFNATVDGFICENEQQHYFAVGSSFIKSCCCDYQVRWKCP